jgi:hypothetical protein
MSAHKTHTPGNHPKERMQQGLIVSEEDEGDGKKRIKGRWRKPEETEETSERQKSVTK